MLLYQVYIGTYLLRILYTGYRGLGKRIKNIEHVLPGINNIRKAKCRGREKFAHELNGDLTTAFRRNSHTAPVPGPVLGIYASHPVCIYVRCYIL